MKIKALFLLIAITFNFTFSFSQDLPNSITDCDCLTKDKCDCQTKNQNEVELEEVLVFGNSYIQKIKTIQENKISKTQIDNYADKSLGDLLNTLSGVSSLSSGSTIIKPIINGLHSSRVIIMNHGVKMQDQDWGVEHAPNIDINSVGNISLIKGAAALQYSGDAIGGLIILEPINFQIKDSIFGGSIFKFSSNGRGGLNTTDFNQSFSNGAYYSLQSTYKRFGDFESPNYILSNTGSEEIDFSLRLGLNKIDIGFDAYFSYYKNNLGIHKASHLHSPGDQIRAIESEFPVFLNDFTYNIENPRQDVTHKLFRLEAFKKFDYFSRLDIKYDFQQNDRYEYDIRLGGRGSIPSIDLQLNTHSIALDFSTKIKEKINLKTGSKIVSQSNFADPVTGVKRIIPDYNKFDLGAYAIIDLNFNENLILELGGRYDYSWMHSYKFYKLSLWKSRNYDNIYNNLEVSRTNNNVLTDIEKEYENFSSVIGLNYELNSRNKILINYSISMRPPNPSELFSEGLHHSAARIELGDLSFDSEKSNKLSLTFQTNQPKYSLSVNPYINNIKNFILIEPGSLQQTIRGSFQVWSYRQTDAILSGVDIDYNKLINEHFSFSSQLSIIRGYDKVKDDFLINMPPLNIRSELVYENKKLNNLRASIESEFVSEQKNYPDQSFNVYIPTTEKFETLDLSKPPSSYNIFNFKTQFELMSFKESIIDFSFSIQNLFNLEYKNYLNRLRYYQHELARNFSVGLSYNF